MISGVVRAPQAPRVAGGPWGWRGPPGARQEEVVAVTPWPGAQTICLRGGGPKFVATLLTMITYFWTRKHQTYNYFLSFSITCVDAAEILRFPLFKYRFKAAITTTNEYQILLSNATTLFKLFCHLATKLSNTENIVVT